MASMTTLPTIIAGAIQSVASPAALPATEIEGAIRYSESDDTLYTFDGASWTAVAGGGGSGITQLTSDVTAGPGSGSQAATVVSVGGQSAANVAAATVLANAATNANTASAIVKRDASGNFSAGTITASLTGTASGNPPNSRTISTSAPLSGGGDLSADRTLSIPVATNSVDGYLSATDHTSFAAKVSSSRAINTSAPLSGGGDLSADRTLSIPVATNAVDGYLSATDHTTFAAKQPAGNYITALTGDVTATGPGSVAASVASVGGASAANVATSVSDTQAATSSNTASTIVKRDASGNFSAGTITASLTGNVSGTSANVTGTVAIANGGTGQTSASAAFDALAPTQTGNSGKFLQTNGTTTSWQSVASSSQSASYSAPSSNVTLTNADNRLQVFAPTADISVTLPTTGVLQGDIWQITNSVAAFSVQVKSSNTNNINLLNPGTLKLVAKVNTPTSATDWYQLEDVTATGISFTGTGTWDPLTEVDYFASFDRQGNKATIHYSVHIVSAISNTQLVLGLPSGLTFDQTDFSLDSSNYATVYGTGAVWDSGTLLPYLLNMYFDGTSFTPAYYTTGGTAGDPVVLQNYVTGTVPITLAAGDRVNISWTIPITEWA